jgi:hypothetical protein
MTKYLVLYRSAISPDEQVGSASPEEAQAGMQAWIDWAGKAGSALVDLGSPLSSVASIGKGDAAAQQIGGFSILEADSKEAVTKLLDGHPHFMVPADSTIEVLEYLPIPGS